MSIISTSALLAVQDEDFSIYIFGMTLDPAGLAAPQAALQVRPSFTVGVAIKAITLHIALVTALLKLMMYAR